VHKRIISTVKRVEFVSEKMSYIILRDRWCHIIDLNIHAPVEDKRNWNVCLINSLNNHMKILLGDFNVKVGGENIFKPTIRKESLHEICNDNGFRLVNFPTSKNLGVKSTMLPHSNIHKYTWMSPDGKTHNRIDHILVDRRRQSNVIDVLDHTGNADCDTDHYLVVA
jgi:endonuclease/exonuclease/phosphatase family metal-dependent hydrolase